MNLRISQIFKRLRKDGLDGLLVSAPANISYLTRYTSRDSYLLISRKGNAYFTDSRYLQEAKNAFRGALPVKKVNGSVFALIARSLKEEKLQRVGFEERYLPFAEHKMLKELTGYAVELVPTHGLIEQERQIKDKRELSTIRKAVQITMEALEAASAFLTPGMTELEVAAELERFIRYRGARSASFDIIVASGVNSSFPHHLTSGRKLKKGECVMIDMGVDYLGYKSDLTRVFFLGKITSLAQRIYAIVRKAQELAIKAIKPNKAIAEVDAESRNYIHKKGFGKYFCHNLGHGVGLEVHEEPHISRKQVQVLKEGMVFTLEPAVYLPKRFGVRIEDMVLVTKKGCEVLSGALDK